jgi:hypothetical protein
VHPTEGRAFKCGGVEWRLVSVLLLSGITFIFRDNGHAEMERTLTDNLYVGLTSFEIIVLNEFRCYNYFNYEKKEVFKHELSF